VARLFGRIVRDRLWASALGDLLWSREAEGRALAMNLMTDCRVSEAREQEFVAYAHALWGGRPPTAQDLVDALEGYLRYRVRDPRMPDFVDGELNGGNFLNGRSAEWDFIPPELELASIFRLDGELFPVLNSTEASPFFQDFDPATPTIDVVAWIGQQRGRLHDRVIVQALLGALNAWRAAGKRHHPTWATTWARFLSLRGLPPTDRLEALGVTVERPCWIVVLKYHVRDVPEPICVPSQLDAGAYGAFHPAARAPGAVSGHPMDLGARPDVLAWEVIHAQCDYDMAQWDAAGSVFELASEHVPDVVEARRRHRKLLDQTYGERTIGGWMSRPRRPR